MEEDNEFRAVLFALAFHAKLSQAGTKENNIPRCSPADHEILVSEAADAAEKGLAEFKRHFGQVP